ncbi:MAG: fumarate hydratase C-terminal domain-containing protein [Lautropia sp.]
MAASNDSSEHAAGAPATEPIRLRMPISAQTAESLRLGDTVVLDGEIVVSAGLPTYQRIKDFIDAGTPLPLDLADGALFHIGSFNRELPDGSFEILYLNPTTSTRFNALMPALIEGLNLHAVGGKGGLDARCAEAMARAGCVYLSFPGGGCASYLEALRGVREVAWPDLISHYRLVRLRVEGLGPATVAIDAQGRSLYDEIVRHAHETRRLHRATL